MSMQASRGAGKQAGKQEAGKKASKASEQVSRQGRSQAQKHLEGIQSEPCPGGACCVCYRDRDLLLIFKALNYN